MSHLSFIKHKSISIETLNEICNLKYLAWPYDMESQLSWIKLNLKNDDIHVLYLSNGKSLAYMNLVQIKINFDNAATDAIGIGNVCSLEHGKGYGSTIIRGVNDYLENEKRPGMLFCKPGLVEFYRKNGWVLIDKSKIKTGIDNKGFETMLYNYNSVFIQLHYNDRQF